MTFYAIVTIDGESVIYAGDSDEEAAIAAVALENEGIACQSGMSSNQTDATHKAIAAVRRIKRVWKSNRRARSAEAKK